MCVHDMLDVWKRRRLVTGGGRKGGGHKWSREGRMFDDELIRGRIIEETVSADAS